MSQPRITIRPVTLTDADQLTDLIREPGLFPRLADETAATTLTRVQARLAECLADTSHAMYVATDATNQVLGYVAVHWLPYLILNGPEGYVSELFVRDAARGQGIGQQLLDVVIQAARVRGCARLQLVNFRNRESYQRGFYAKHGWQERPDAASFVLML